MGDKPKMKEVPKVGTGDKPKTKEVLKVGTGDKPKTKEVPKVGTGDKPKTKEVPKVGTGDIPKSNEVLKVINQEIAKEFCPPSQMKTILQNILAPMLPVEESPQRNIKFEQDRKRCSTDTDGKNPHKNKRVHRDTCVLDLVDLVLDLFVKLIIQNTLNNLTSKFLRQ